MTYAFSGFRIVSAALAASLALASAAPAQDACGICAKVVVVNAALAKCFLERYPQLAARGAGAVAVNLEDCEEERGVVPPLRGPQNAAEPPTLRFIVSYGQLGCIKSKLEEPGIVLDPSYTIDLDAC